MSRAHSSHRIGSVYLIGSKGSRLVKIGVSIDVRKRLATLQTMSPTRLTLLWSIEGSYDLEAALHERFAEYRKHGEWFDFGGQDTVTLVSAAAAELQRLPPPGEGEVNEPILDEEGSSGARIVWAGPERPVTVQKGYLLDDRLSAAARGIGAYMFAMDNGTTYEAVAEANRCTLDQLSAALDELEATGYAQRDGDGQLSVADIRADLTPDGT